MERAIEIAQAGLQMTPEESAQYLRHDAAEPITGENFCRWIALGLANTDLVQRRVEQIDGARVHTRTIVDQVEVENS